jgi:hypothetical protein
MSLIRGYNKSTRFHVIGIGSGVNEHLVKGVVRQGNGECAFIHPGERIEPKMIKLFQKLMMPVLTDLRISLSKEGWEICSEKGVIVAGVPSTFFARRSSCSGIPDTINICAKIADKTFSWDIQVVGNGGNDLPISQLWARERIRELEEGENSGSGSRQKERKHDKRNQAIIEVSRKYGVISTLTSLIGIEKRVDAEKNTSEIVLRRVPSLITKGWHGGLTNVSRSSVMGPLAGIGNCISTLNEANYVYNVHTSLRKIVSNKTFRETDYSIRSKITKKTDQKDVLFEILNLQKPTGGLELNDTLFKELVISKHDLIQAERDAYPSNEKSIRLILSTAILLEVLEQHFPDMEDIWRPTVKKSSEWLDAAISKTNVQIGGIHLKEWAAGFSKNKVKYSENPCLNT